MPAPTVEEKKLIDLINDPRIKRPDYQRPYKWEDRHVLAMLNDIVESKDKSLFGVIILHDKTDDHHDVVDGLQRLTTIALINYALTQEQDSQNEIPAFFDTKNEISRVRVKKNLEIIHAWKKKRSETELQKIRHYINQNCFVVVIHVKELSEAFQMFESQNSKGKKLKAHDLLKAYHYRKTQFNEQNKEKNPIIKWEKTTEKQLCDLFQILFSIRRWSKGFYLEWDLTKENRAEFQGIDIELQNSQGREQNSQDARIKKIVLAQAKEFNKNAIFSTSPIVNGEFFFKWIVFFLSSPFRGFIESVYSNPGKKSQFLGDDKSIIDAFLYDEDYDGRYRRGDEYCRRVFQILLFFYVDRFVNFDDDFLENSQSPHWTYISLLFRYVYKKRIKGYLEDRKNNEVQINTDSTKDSTKKGKRDPAVKLSGLLNELAQDDVFRLFLQMYDLNDFILLEKLSASQEDLKGYLKKRGWKGQQESQNVNG